MKYGILLLAGFVIGAVCVMEYNKHVEKQKREEYHKLWKPWVSYDIEPMKESKSYLDKLLSEN
jgi:hypothetical protein